MGQLQPGVGYNLVQSPHGDALEILFPPFPDPPAPIIQEFEVKLTDNVLKVAKGRVITRSSPNEFTGGCLREYNLQGFAVVPLLSFTDGTEADTSPWADDGGYVTLETPLESGPDAYGVYIIRNQYVVGTSTLVAGTPYLAVLPVGGDAETKTKPWGGESDCDGQTWKTVIEEVSVSIETPGPPPWYEPTTVSGYLGQNRYDKLYSYNCQRLKIASIDWDTDNLVWIMKQYLIGTLTLPYNIFYAGETRWESSLGPPPSFFDTPYYNSQQTDWEGDYTDCQKWDGTGYNPTISLNL